MTTIITKNGSGAPTAGQLSEGELAVDLTNKELYTKSGSTVIKIGSQGGSSGTFTDLTATSSFTSPGIDDNATSTAITIDSSENVGIGVTDPASYSVAPELVVDTGASGGITILGSGGTGSYGGVFFGDGAGTDAYKGFIQYNHDNGGSVDQMIIGAGNAEAIRIDSTGNVGIGQDAPSAPLTVDGPSNDTYVARFGNFAGGGGSIQGRTDIGLDFWATENGTHPAAAVGVEQVSTDQYRGGLLFSTRGTNSDVAPVERMRISSSGNVGIGTDTPVSALHVDGDYVSVTNGDVFGYLQGTGSSFQIGTASTSVIKELTLATGGGTRMVIDSSGNVGIGTSVPDATLTVKPQSAAIGTHENQNWSYDSTNTGVEFDLKLKQVVSSGLVKYKFDLRNSGTSYDNNLVLDRGNVSIGTSAPVDKFDVKASGDDERLVRISHPSSPTAAAGYFGFTDTGLGANTGVALGVQYAGGYYDAITIDRETRNVGIGTTSPSAIISSSKIAQVASTGNTTLSVTSTDSVNDRSAIVELLSSGNGNSKSIILYGDTDTSPSTPSPLVFQGYHSGARTERMRLDASGNLLIGVTTSVGGSSEGVEIRGDAGYIKTARNNPSAVAHWLLYNSTGLVGSVTTENNTTLFNSLSDERVKENVVDAPAGNIDAVQVRSFDWKSNGEHQEYGFIAQELETVAPYAVSKGETDEDMWAVDYSKLVPMMIKEIQDLKAEVAALKGA